MTAPPDGKWAITETRGDAILTYWWDPEEEAYICQPFDPADIEAAFKPGVEAWDLGRQSWRTKLYVWLRWSWWAYLLRWWTPRLSSALSRRAKKLPDQGREAG
jgi:hypothetical protein